MNLFKNQSGCVDTAGYRGQKKKINGIVKKILLHHQKKKALKKLKFSPCCLCENSGWEP
jgi:hypothetical protein